MDNYSSGTPDNLKVARSRSAEAARFALLSLDVQAPELVDVISGTNPDVVFHLAATFDGGATGVDPLYDARINVLGTINVCEASRRCGVRRVVYATSLDVPPLSPHSAAKLSGELYMRAYAETHNLAPICLAMTSVYGPRQIAHGPVGDIAEVATAMIANRAYAAHCEVRPRRDFVYVDDVIDALMLAGCAPQYAMGTYRIDSGVQTPAAEVYDLIAEVLDEVGPGPSAGHCELGTRASRLPDRQNELGWTPKVVLSEGIRRTVSWLRSTLPQLTEPIGG